MSNIRRIGILTGGGDCPGLNAVIRAVAKSALHQHDWEVYGIEDGFLGLIENRVHPLGWEHVSNILTKGGTILGSSNKADPSRFVVGKEADGSLRYENVISRVVQHVQRRELDLIMCIGGDGTMTAAATVAEHGVNFIGLPKTIDNDLMHTEITFGFQTAVNTASEALDRIHTTASSHHRVMLVEMMGRNAGWLTLHAAVATGADIILIPEIPYDLDVICDHCRQRSRRGKAFTIVAVAEGARPIGGQQVVDQFVKDSPDPIRLGGISEVLAHQISDKTSLECRATILGHVQRGGTPVPADRVLGTLFGCKAVDLAAAGKFNELVVMQRGELTSVPLSSAANQQRLVTTDHALVKAARSTGIIFGEPAQ